MSSLLWHYCALVHNRYNKYALRLQGLRVLSDSQPKRVPNHLPQVTTLRGQQIRVQRRRQTVSNGYGRVL